MALRDLKDYVREAAAEAVGACLQLVAERENGSLLSCYDKTFEEAQMVQHEKKKPITHNSSPRF